VKIVPVVAMVLAGALAGAVGAELLGAAPEAGLDGSREAEATAEAADGGEEDGATPGAAPGERGVVALGRRMVVPVVTDRRTRAVVLLDLAVEVPAALVDPAHAAIPRLRDRFLRTLLSLSAAGAFGDGIADPVLMERLRTLLRRDAGEVLGDAPVEVLVTEALMREV
jgi:hypothetical protein